MVRDVGLDDVVNGCPRQVGGFRGSWCCEVLIRRASLGGATGGRLRLGNLVLVRWHLCSGDVGNQPATEPHPFSQPTTSNLDLIWAGVALGVTVTLILAVDDEPDLRDLVALALRAGRHEVLTAPNGPTALALASARLPDAVVTDYQMPGMTGVERREPRRTRTLRPARRGGWPCGSTLISANWSRAGVLWRGGLSSL